MRGPRRGGEVTVRDGEESGSLHRLTTEEVN